MANAKKKTATKPKPAVGLDATLAKLAATIAEDPELADSQAFRAGKAVTAKQLDARASKLGTVYPPSFRDAVIAHGLFGLGNDKTNSQLAFRIWPLAQHRSALARYADELGCDPRPRPSPKRSASTKNWSQHSSR